MSMRVLHIVNKWQGGGVERYVETLVRAADPDGFEMAVASVHTGIDTDAPCAVHGPLVPEGAGTAASARAVGGLVARLRPDIVHVHTNNGTGFDYARAATDAGAPVRIVHSHNSAFDASHRVAKRLYTDLARARGMGSVTLAWACSDAAGKHLFGRRPFEVMRNGIDTERFAFDPVARGEARAELGISPDALVLGFAARLTEVKNPLFALRILEAFRAELPDVQMVFIGDGPVADELADAVEAKGLAGCCWLLGFRTDPERWYSAMDALVAPSLYEGLPINLVEAQASGLVVLASDAITDEVVLRPAAFRMRSLSEQPSAWCEGLGTLIAGARWSRATAHEDVARAGYDWHETTSRVLGAYEEAMAAWRA